MQNSTARELADEAAVSDQSRPALRSVGPDDAATSPDTAPSDPALVGEAPPWADDALVVAPIAGRFHPADLPSEISPGTVVGEIRQFRQRQVVVSPFGGDVRAQLVEAGHPVTGGQPVIWLTRTN